MELTHTRSQLPIGQGFFHCGTVSLGGSPFNYVYDCGSEQPTPLRKAVRKYLASLGGQDIDLLFVSHLDVDHVSGLDQLLIGSHVKTAIVPYLSPAARLAAIAKATFDNHIIGSFVELLCDPTNWFNDRGVDSIVYVMPGSPPEGLGPEGTIPPFPEGNDGSFSDELKLILPRTKQLPPENPTPKARAGSNVLIMDCSLPLYFNTIVGAHSLQRSPNWQFITFVHPEGEREQAFRKLVRDNLGRDAPIGKNRFEINQQKLLILLQSSSGRDRLAACYVAIRANRNLTSLSVYSGPIRVDGITCHLVDDNNYVLPADAMPCGWIGTGDANFASATRRREFVEHFQSVWSMVWTLTLPHHGSKHNWHAELASRAQRFVVSCGKKNKYGHPHLETRQTIRRDRIVQTTEKNGSSNNVQVKLE